MSNKSGDADGKGGIVKELNKPSTSPIWIFRQSGEGIHPDRRNSARIIQPYNTKSEQDDQLTKQANCKDFISCSFLNHVFTDKFSALFIALCAVTAYIIKRIDSQHLFGKEKKYGTYGTQNEENDPGWHRSCRAGTGRKQWADS